MYRYSGVREFIPKHSIQILIDLNTLVADGMPIFPTHKKQKIDGAKLTRSLIYQITKYIENWSRGRTKNSEEVDLKSAEKIIDRMQKQISKWFSAIESDEDYRVSKLMQKLIPSKLNLDHAVVSLLVWSCIDDDLRSLHSKVNRLVKHDTRKSATAVQEVVRSLFEIDACLFPSLAGFPPSSDASLPAISLALNQLSFRNTQVSRDFLAGIWPHRELALHYAKTSSPYRAFSIIILRELLIESGDDTKSANLKIAQLYQNLGTGMSIEKYAKKSLHDQIELPDPALIWKKYSIFLLALEIAPIK